MNVKDATAAILRHEAFYGTCADTFVENVLLDVRATALEEAAAYCERARTEVLMPVPDRIINDTLTAAANEIRELKKPLAPVSPTTPR